jgi:alkylation response protein AidB-like acyl-CoA dehydrogenase
MPANLPGISMQFMELINRGTQHFVWFEDVRVSREYLIGGETQGWQVAQTSLELEHGAEGSLNGRVGLVDDLLRDLRAGKVHTSEHGDAASETLVDALIREKINRLISRRNFWMFRSKQPMSYHGSQNLWFGRETRIRTSEDLLALLGPHALMDDEKWGLLKGQVEYTVRNGSMATHAAGSYEIDKVIMARRIGMSRTKETMAPTHQG